MRRRTRALAASLLVLSLAGCRAAGMALTSSRVTAEEYTPQEILGYFDEIAFSSEYGGYRGTICKWTDELVCFVTGDFAEGEMTVLCELAGRLNEIPGFPGIRMTDDEEAANFVVRFVMQGELVGLFGADASAASGMSRFYWMKSSGKIVRAEAGIASNITPQNAKASVICEEFLQSLGLASDSCTYPESVFYEGYNGSLRPAEIDWAVLELLYSDAIRPGMARKDALAAARELLGIPEETDSTEETEEEENAA